ncbi:MAG: sarcosine oxidase subunit delta [Geminicoccaceae bacterium]|nr:sarcosine oxidase subunit delta [Geminicoccaceae bacterium]
MHQIRCPWCGVRDEAEFQYKGDATKRRPADGAGEAAFFDYVYQRRNPKGWHVEWWHHVTGCRRFVKVVRHTVTHRIHVTGWPDDDLEVPE